MHRFLAFLLVPALACGASPTADALADEPAADRQALAGVHDLTYETAHELPRTIQIDVRLPDAPNGTVVVWSHGGGQGRNRAETVGTRWGTAFNREGVTFVAVAHTPRTQAEKDDWCEKMALDDCHQGRPLRWDRAFDAAVVFDWVEANADTLGVDMGRLVYGGHSAGSRGALVVAGATSNDPAIPLGPADPRPVALILASPTPGDDLDLDSLAAIDLPILGLTGVGDDTSSAVPQDRLDTLDALTSARTFLAWSEHPNNRHVTFDLEKLPSREVGRDLALAGTMFVEAVTSDRLDDLVDAFAARSAQGAVSLG